MNSCPHLKEYKEVDGAGTFRIIQAFFINTKNTGQKEAKECICQICKTKSGRIDACLSCVFFGCYDDQHIQKHAKKKHHSLAVDTTLGTVYCYLCDDYVYDQEFDAIAKRRELQPACVTGTDVYSACEPTPNEKELLKEHYQLRKIIDGSYLGLRGLVNLGNTCYMNSIIQVLIHTPLLRDYFLAEKHVCRFQDEPSTCLVCEMSSLFQEFYCGQGVPYASCEVLYLVWMHARHLSGYYQQDAHEFLITFLNILHLHCKGMKVDVPYANNDPICDCIIDKIFTGFLQSELVCVKCKNVSTTVERFFCMSLDLGSCSQHSDKDAADANSSEPSSLSDCLERFTQPENLGACKNCIGLSMAQTKQLTVQKLPLVISFHFNRLSGLGKKNTKFISFPECLDMTPFTSSVRSIATAKTSETLNNCSSHSDNKFYLFAVVNHVGNEYNGHYFSFVRQNKNSWFKCDDHLVSKASVQEVLSSEAYLLFYHKQTLDYEVSDDDISKI